MKNKTKIGIICIVILLLIIVAFAGFIFWHDNIRCSTIQGVVVEVKEKSMLVLGKEGKSDLYSVGYADEGNIGFEKGQEVIVYYNGYIQESYPATPTGVKKIEIVKEKSDIEIPKDVLGHSHSSMDNVNVTISELHDSGITINIKDTNELPYDISHKYELYKRTTETVKTTKDDIETNFTPVEVTKEVEAWRLIKKISDVSCEETEIKENINHDNSLQVRKFDWTTIYGKLQPRKISV